MSGLEDEDDRADLHAGDRVMLVIEDDLTFARVVVDAARERGFKAVVATRGAQALALAREYRPHGITLDLQLPDIDGWRLLEILKSDAATRHIPLTIMSAADASLRGMRHGAIAHLVKPVARPELEGAIADMADVITRDHQRLLIVENDDAQREGISRLVGADGILLLSALSGREGLDALLQQPVDCVILDPALPDMTTFDFLEEVRKSGRERVPIVVYGDAGLSPADEARLRAMAESLVLKNVRSPERLLDETTLFLHRSAERLPESQRQMLERLHDTAAMLTGRRVLVVDDDPRNIFALTSLLERNGMDVVPAETGMDALALLEKEPGIDAVLMDIMMPDMDGYHTIRAIRSSRAQHASVPVIALTAKAMKGDREKCVEAGASDYIAKPADPAQLLSLLRVWLHR